MVSNETRDFPDSREILSLEVPGLFNRDFSRLRYFFLDFSLHKTRFCPSQDDVGMQNKIGHFSFTLPSGSYVLERGYFMGQQSLYKVDLQDSVHFMVFYQYISELM